MFYKNKKVLVTGSTGLVGSNMVLTLLKEGAQVRAAYHKSPPRFKKENLENVPCDLSQMQSCLEITKGIDYVFHCAANTSGATVMKNNPLVHITPNLILNSQMLEAAFHNKVQNFLFMSSSTVYPDLDHPMREDEAFIDDPFEIYFGVGWMKRYIEKLAQFYYRRFGFKIALIRPTNIYGPYDKFDEETSHVIPALVRRAVEKQNPYEVWGDGTAERDFIYVEDMVQAMLLALEKACNCQPVNFSSGHTITIKKLVELILKQTGQNQVKIIFDASKPTTIPKRTLDLTHCQKVLGYRAQTPFEQGLEKTIHWYQSTLA